MMPSSRLSSYAAIKLANKLSLPPARLAAAGKETPFQVGEGESVLSIDALIPREI